MNSNSVDLIATDPPFNKGRDFHATPDSLAEGAKFQDRWSWENDVHQEWVDQITDDHPKLMEAIESAKHAHSDGMGAFMCFMAVRLLEMRRVLKPTGSIYLHCDPTASHYLKAIMDAIFGYKNFRNEIVWCYSGGGTPKKDFPRKHDIILKYAKGTKYTFNTERRPYGKHNTTGKRATDLGGTRKLEYHSEGTPINDWWTDIKPLINWDKERLGYPTQKPLALYERIIKASSNKGDIVLDPFAGCATTLVAAERLGREWVGIDIWDNAHKVVFDRLQKEGLTDTRGIAEGGALPFEQMHYETEPPERTDDEEIAAPDLVVRLRVKEPAGARMSRAEMYEILLSKKGTKCQGCDREFDDPRYLELDHNTPRSDGGINHVSNRVLLCSPCNKAKSNQYTLSGLRRLNKKNGWMANL